MYFLWRSLKATILILLVYSTAAHVNVDAKEQVAGAEAAPVKQFRILSLDGGGIRGIIPATILADIEAVTKQKITELFDIIGGTSTGGLIALYLNIPDENGKQKYTAAEIITKYKELSEIVFQKSLGRALRSVGGLFAAKYDVGPFEKLLQREDNFGKNRVLSQSVKPVLVTSIDINKVEQNKVVFSTVDAKAAKAAYDQPMWLAARATSAAPTFFNPVAATINGQNVTLADGGVGDNNPAFTILEHAVKNRLVAGYDQIVVVSIGTGITDKINRIRAQERAGVKQALKPLIDALFASQETMSNDCSTFAIGKENFFRLSPIIEEKYTEMDKPANILPLEQQASTFIQTEPYLRMLCRVFGKKCDEWELLTGARGAAGLPEPCKKGQKGCLDY